MNILAILNTGDGPISRVKKFDFRSDFLSILQDNTEKAYQRLKIRKDEDFHQNQKLHDSFGYSKRSKSLTPIVQCIVRLIRIQDEWVGDMDMGVHKIK
jgi:hypothetical protein